MKTTHNFPVKEGQEADDVKKSLKPEILNRESPNHVIQMTQYLVTATIHVVH